MKKREEEDEKGLALPLHLYLRKKRRIRCMVVLYFSNPSPPNHKYAIGHKLTKSK